VDEIALGACLGQNYEQNFGSSVNANKPVLCNPREVNGLNFRFSANLQLQ
jgi:hypothetical protein